MRGFVNLAKADGSANVLSLKTSFNGGQLSHSKKTDSVVLCIRNMPGFFEAFDPAFDLEADPRGVL